MAKIPKTMSVDLAPGYSDAETAANRETLGRFNAETITEVATVAPKAFDSIKMRRVMYLVAPSVEAGVADALARGWRQIARTRFVTPENNDIWLVCRFNEFVPFRGEATPMIKAAGYDEGEGALVLENWIKDMERFEEFVESGAGEWVDSWDTRPPTAE